MTGTGTDWYPVTISVHKKEGTLILGEDEQSKKVTKISRHTRTNLQAIISRTIHHSNQIKTIHMKEFNKSSMYIFIATSHFQT